MLFKFRAAPSAKGCGAGSTAEILNSRAGRRQSHSGKLLDSRHGAGYTLKGMWRESKSSAVRFVALLLALCAAPLVLSAQGEGDYGRLERAAELIRQGRLSGAEAELAAVLRVRPEDANALNLLGVVRAQQGRAGEAEELFTRAIRSSQTLVGAYLNLGQLYAEARKLERALWAFGEARKLAPDRPEIAFNLGALQEQKGELEAAADSFQAALALRPDSVAALRALARVARARGEYAKALPHLVRARRLAPDSPAVLYDFGWTALNLNLLPEAIAALESLQKMSPAEPGYLYALAIARLHNGDRAVANDLAARYVQLRPQDARGHYVLGAALYSLKQYGPARAALERSLELSAYSEAEYYLGMIAHEEGDHEQAVRRLRRAVEADPKNAAAHTGLGVIFLTQKNYEAARASLEEAVHLDPRDTKAHYQLGIVYSRTGQKERAREMFALSEKLRGEQRAREVIGFRLVDPPK